MVALSTYPTDERSTTTRCSPEAMSFWTAAENSDSSGYMRRDSPTRTTAMPLACSVVMFIRIIPLVTRRLAAPTLPLAQRLLVLQPLELMCELDTPAVDARLHRAFRQ